MTTNNNPTGGPGANYYGSNNAFADFFTDYPQAAYYSSPRGTAFSGQSANTQRYYQNQFQNVYNEFLGALGQQIRSGADPTLRFADYLETTPFTERYAALPPQMAGRTTRQFGPGTRQIYF